MRNRRRPSTPPERNLAPDDPKQPRDLSAWQYKTIVNAIEKNPDVTLIELSEILKCSVTGILRYSEHLLEAKLISQLPGQGQGQGEGEGSRERVRASGDLDLDFSSNTKTTGIPIPSPLPDAPAHARGEGKGDLGVGLSPDQDPALLSLDELDEAIAYLSLPHIESQLTAGDERGIFYKVRKLRWLRAYISPKQRAHCIAIAQSIKDEIAANRRDNPIPVDISPEKRAQQELAARVRQAALFERDMQELQELARRNRQ